MAYAEIITALADPTRRAVLEALRAGPRSVGALAQGRPVSRPAISQHLRVLEHAGLVSVVAQGNQRIYAIRRDGLAELRAYLDGFWNEALTAYSAEIQRRFGN